MNRSVSKAPHARQLPLFKKLAKYVMRHAAPVWHGSRSSLRRAVRTFLQIAEQRRLSETRLRRLCASPAALVVLLSGLLGSGVTASAGTTYVEHTGAANPFNGISLFSIFDYATVADVDGDEDLDVIVNGEPDNDGSFVVLLENSGTPQSPLFAIRTGANNPFDGIERFSPAGIGGPEFADFDNDGDNEMALVDSEIQQDFSFHGIIRYFENDGENGFVELTGVSNLFDGITSGRVFPDFLVLSDIDQDGDVDAIFPTENSIDGTDLILIENEGTPSVPVMVAQTGSNNPFNDLVFGSGIRTQVADFDGDGNRDVAHAEIESSDFFVNYYENRGGLNLVDISDTVQNPFGNFAPFATGAFFTTVDYDEDGDFDVVLGGDDTYYGSAVGLFENIGDPMNVVLQKMTGTSNPFDGFPFDVAVIEGPRFADFDDDGDLDFFVANSDGYGLFNIRYFENKAIDTGVEPNSLTDSWVDFNHAGDEQGTELNPFNTLDEGVTALVDDGSGTLHVKPGATSETPTIEKPMRIQAEGGTATIGQLP